MEAVRFNSGFVYVEYYSMVSCSGIGLEVCRVRFV